MCSTINLFKSQANRIVGGIRNLSTKCDNLQSYFLNPRIHKLLQLLVSSCEPSLAHDPRFKVEKDQDIKLLTGAELQSIQRYSEMLTSQKLHMPPVMNPRPIQDPKALALAKDPGLCGILPSNQKLVFVDIGLDSSRRRRLMVVREPDGTLRYADSSESDRWSQIFFPLPGKRLRIPSIFTDANLNMALEEGSHEYILDYLLIQFEPDDPEYVRISHRVYDHALARIWSFCHEVEQSEKEENTLNQRQKRDNQGVVTRLRATRHYGPMALYVVAKLGKPEGLIQELLAHQALDTLHHLLHLTCIIRPETTFARTMLAKHQFPTSFSSTPTLSDTLKYTQTFIETFPLDEDHKAQLQLSLIQCRESSSEPMEPLSQTNSR